ncbi:MAG: bifunctional diguanylate cyclase/phosphodiesterase [Pseudolabrys sp.]|nr:bifunctional diguanylate cyclase/phosphodiesterase [Pseudolabrys sp.]
MTRARARRVLSASQWIAVLAIVAVGATMITAAVGYEMARRSDEKLWTEQRASLRNAMAEFRGLFGRSGSIDPGFVRMAEQNAGLKDLKFETNPASSQREMQPAIDAQGRIAGFFTWDRVHPMTETMNRLMPLIAGIAIVLVIFAGVALGMLRRAQRDLAASEAQAQRAADSDKLTGLPNHAKMLELLDLALAERAGPEITSFVLIEVDGLADVDAQCGNDELVAAVANALQQALPPSATVGRIGSDKFAVAITGADEVEPAIRAALDAMTRPDLTGTAVRVSAHAGFAQTPRHATTRGELTRRAELALRAAAEKGPGAIVGFDMSFDVASADHKFITRELPRALEANELELHYQPIVAANGGKMVGVEALLRWTHPVRGPIGPAVFIPVAEQMGFMEVLGAFVLRRALMEAKRWPDLYVAVNLSPLQVRDASIVDLVRAALRESGVAPERLVLEITEGVLIDNPEEMVQRIDDLHALGVSVALDDFGSGYSNLGYLQRFPLDKLKIDRSFVAGLGTSANGGVIIQAIVALGRALGLSVLVEGVETEQQRVLLRLAGCDEMQGYLFAKPAPARAIDRLLAQARQGRTPEALTA